MLLVFDLARWRPHEEKKTARNDGFQVNILKFSVLNIIMYVINYFKESFNDAPDG